MQIICNIPVYTKINEIELKIVFMYIAVYHVNVTIIVSVDGALG